MARFSKKKIAEFEIDSSVNWRIDPYESFVNPYTFIPLGKQCSRQKPEQGPLSGYIECELTTHTPLIIPNTSGPKSEENTFYNFYGYKNLEGVHAKEKEYYPPVVPGSEIRGAIRSVHEAATNSCMRVINTDPKDYLSRRSSIPRNETGILKYIDGQWVLFEAKKYKVSIEDRGAWKRFEQGSRVAVERHGNYKVQILRTVPLSAANKPEYYLHFSKRMPKKKYESVFQLTDKEICRFRDDHESIVKLRELLKSYASDEPKSSEPNYSTYLERLEKKDGRAICVYYYKPENFNNKFLFAPSSISKDMFLNQPNVILKEHGGYQPCEDPNCLCPSCSLFGMVGKDGAMGSRLRFTDATVVNPLGRAQDYYERDITIALASPKPSAAEFYLERPTIRRDKRPADHWNYDYAVRYDRKLNKLEVIQYEKAVLRGRKFYWHGQPVMGYQPSNNEKLKRTVRPVKPRITFGFKIYFHRLTEQELANLKWVLELQNPAGGNHMHKIGHAKPLGMGSVKVAVKQIKIRDSHQLQENGTFDYRPYKPAAHTIDEIPLKQLLKVTDFDFPGKKLVSYPKVSGRRGQEVHQWFTANQSIRIINKEKIKTSAFPPVIFDELPHIDEEDQTLHKYEQSKSRKPLQTKRK